MGTWTTVAGEGTKATRRGNAARTAGTRRHERPSLSATPQRRNPASTLYVRSLLNPVAHANPTSLVGPRANAANTARSGVTCRRAWHARSAGVGYHMGSKDYPHQEDCFVTIDDVTA